ncbi:G-protein beta WD-40 repeats containing protein [Reticulomyxa filosa]|uniref:G-protein beta WD-40 repeats containing protein n=1 Tax=Reticulomyxa filosa TaxID=46433 RepID=X6MZH3_RETFI|nr:G-protein beta WD-40 repeats containing protein [Reticulomyxa filosa]|eukprot:ETO19231.1 G-protein beta WD-40 repeats containing protein [Reticulomyxa filosa]
MIDTFCLSSKVLNTFIEDTTYVYSIDYTIFDGDQFICSGSDDKITRVWNIDNGEKIQSFNGHMSRLHCVKFSQYHYHYHHRNVICSSSYDKTIRFWDIKDNQQLQVFTGQNDSVSGIAFSPFSSGRYLCSGYDNTIRLWDVETSKSLYSFDGHTNGVRCVDISPLQSNNNNKSNDIGAIGGNGYTICSGSNDNTICVWDIETAKKLILFQGHTDYVMSVKYGSNKLVNIILSGSCDQSVRLWDIRSGQQVQVFNGHTSEVWDVEYSPFAVNNNEFGGYSNVICSGSWDSTIRFWDVRSSKKELYIINGKNDNCLGITCLKFIGLKKKGKSNQSDLKLCYGSRNGRIFIWG